MLSGQGLEIVCFMDPSTQNQHVLGDPDRLRQVTQPGINHSLAADRPYADIAALHICDYSLLAVHRWIF